MPLGGLLDLHQFCGHLHCSTLLHSGPQLNGDLSYLGYGLPRLVLSLGSSCWMHQNHLDTLASTPKWLCETGNHHQCKSQNRICSVLDDTLKLVGDLLEGYKWRPIERSVYFSLYRTQIIIHILSRNILVSSIGIH